MENIGYNPYVFKTNLNQIRVIQNTINAVDMVTVYMENVIVIQDGVPNQIVVHLLTRLQLKANNI